MMGITRRWQNRPGIEKIDLYTRAPLYLISASEPLVVLLVLNAGQPVRPWAATLLVLVTGAHTVACLAILRAALGHPRHGVRPSRRLIGTGLGLTLAGVLTGAAAMPALDRFLGSDGFPVGLALVAVLCGGVTAAITPALSARALVIVVAAPAAVLGAAQVVADPPPQPPWAVNYLLVVGVLALVYRSSTWILHIVWEVNRGREAQTRLAVAEERLRMTRDLHDVLGRSLTLIAMNSELAAQLAPANADAAADRMRQVRRSAEDSMREVREVVAGHRSTDLDTELSGARSILRSAGIDTRVIGDGTALPREAQTALGWAVREATTNILRHAEPTTVRINLSTATDESGARSARLRIENDGIRNRPSAAPRDGHGHGLAGLEERLRQQGGSLTAGPEPAGRFAIEVRVPLTQHESKSTEAEESVR